MRILEDFQHQFLGEYRDEIPKIGGQREHQHQDEQHHHHGREGERQRAHAPAEAVFMHHDQPDEQIQAERRRAHGLQSVIEGHFIQREEIGKRQPRDARQAEGEHGVHHHLENFSQLALAIHQRGYAPIGNGEQRHGEKYGQAQVEAVEAVKADMQERAELEETAKIAKVEKTDGLTNAELKEGIVKAAFGESFKLDGASDAYLDGAYSAAKEMLRNDNAKHQAAQAKGGAKEPETKNDSANDARSRMIARMRGEE